MAEKKVTKRRKFDAACYKKSVAAGRSSKDAMTLCSAKSTAKQVGKVALDVASLITPFGGFTKKVKKK